ncbi:Pvc16 family protein [Kribbella sp. NPDC003557]|uniref:Pvc16 family protein n=1 Tax=Kribbella sp. NPDC003557 TaxID=3154449 RepID=UPI00339E0726
MLDEAEQAIGTLLRQQLPAGTTIRTEPPTDTWSTERPETESIGLFLHLIRESDAEGAVQGWSEDRDQSGRVIRRRAAERQYELCYLVTAWAGGYERELTLLGCVLRAVAHHSTVPAAMLTGTLEQVSGPVTVAIGRAEAPSAVPELWSALGLRPRTFLDLVVTAPVAPVAITDIAGPPATIDLSVDSAPLPGRGPSTRRRARITEGPADAGPGGEAR